MHEAAARRVKSRVTGRQKYVHGAGAPRKKGRPKAALFSGSRYGYTIADPEPVVSTSVVCGVAEAGEGNQRTPERSARGTLAVT